MNDGNGRAFGGRDAILNAADLKHEDVDATEWWGCWIRIREMNALEKHEFGIQLLGDDGEAHLSRMAPDMMTRIVMMCVVDKIGNRVFTDEDVQALGKKNPAPIELIASKVFALSGMGADAIDKGKDVSESTATTASPSD